MNLFDYLNNISNGKEDVSGSEEFQSEYNEFMINRFLSMSMDTIFFANEASKMYNLPKKLQYQFLFHGISKKNRYFKYAKADKIDKSIKNIIEYYHVRHEVALEYLELLSKDQLKEINLLYEGKIKRIK
jgi:hypothetical protein